jgi:hypothetical protein
MGAGVHHAELGLTAATIASRRELAYQLTGEGSFGTVSGNLVA